MLVYGRNVAEEFLKNNTEASLMSLLQEYNKHIDTLADLEMNPDQKKAILQTKIDALEKDKDYRLRKKTITIVENGQEVQKEVSYCTFNEILENIQKIGFDKFDSDLINYIENSEDYKTENFDKIVYPLGYSAN